MDFKNKYTIKLDKYKNWILNKKKEVKKCKKKTRKKRNKFNGGQFILIPLFKKDNTRFVEE